MEYELYHHGILGMKWGIRRYQNRDGSLTPAGRRRYHNEDGSLNEEGKKYYDSFSDDEKRFQELSRKNPSQLSTQELQFMNNRIQAKNQYLSNTESQFSKILKTAALQTVSQLTAEYMKAGTKKVLSWSGEKVSNMSSKKKQREQAWEDLLNNVKSKGNTGDTADNKGNATDNAKDKKKNKKGK